MITVSIEEMQRDLVGYLHRIKAGETLIIMQADRVLAEVKSVADIQEKKIKHRRPFGLAAGEFTVPEDFDDPLPEDIQNLFEGK